MGALFPSHSVPCPAPGASETRSPLPRLPGTRVRGPLPGRPATPRGALRAGARGSGSPAPAAHARGRGRDSPPALASRPLLPDVHPPLLSRSGLRTPAPAPVAVCNLRGRRRRLPFAGGSGGCRFDVLVQGAPGPDSAGLPSPSAGVMRASGAVQVLGFLLSLARGSEVGNSQAGEWRGAPAGWDLGADPEAGPEAQSCGAGTTGSRVWGSGSSPGRLAGTAFPDARPLPRASQTP